MLVVDDDGALRALVRAAMAADPRFEVVAEAADGSTALRLAVECQPDVVVLDLGLPDVTGQEVLTGLRHRVPRASVVVYTGTEPPSRKAVFDLGASGLVLKGEALSTLLRVAARVAERAASTARVDLPQRTASTREARAFVAEHLDRWDAPELADDAVLVVSELVTNAIRHGRSDCVLALHLTHEVLRIEVTDTGAGTPEPQPPSTTRPGGRGLLLVSALAAAWGIDPAPVGKVVWAELARAAPDR